MKDNQIKIDPSGVWIKTRRSNVQLWRSLITETLKFHGFQLLHSTPFKDSYYELSSDHHVHQFDSFEQLSVNVFRNGHIRIDVRNIDRFFECIIPHLERTLDVKFQWVPGSEKHMHTETVCDYLTDKIHLGLSPYSATSSTLAHNNIMRRYEVADAIRRRSEVEETAYSRMENELQSARKELKKAKTKLEQVDSKLHDMSGNMFDFNEMRRENLQACLDVPAYPSLGYPSHHVYPSLHRSRSYPSLMYPGWDSDI